MKPCAETEPVCEPAVMLDCCDRRAPRPRPTLTLSAEGVRAAWASLAATVRGVSAATDTQTRAQWEIAEALFAKLDAFMNPNPEPGSYMVRARGGMYSTGIGLGGLPEMAVRWTRALAEEVAASKRREGYFDADTEWSPLPPTVERRTMPRWWEYAACEGAPDVDSDVALPGAPANEREVV